MCTASTALQVEDLKEKKTNQKTLNTNMLTIALAASQKKQDVL